MFRQCRQFSYRVLGQFYLFGASTHGGEHGLVHLSCSRYLLGQLRPLFGVGHQVVASMEEPPRRAKTRVRSTTLRRMSVSNWLHWAVAGRSPPASFSAIARRSRMRFSRARLGSLAPASPHSSSRDSGLYQPNSFRSASVRSSARRPMRPGRGWTVGKCGAGSSPWLSDILQFKSVQGAYCSPVWSCLAGL